MKPVSLNTSQVEPCPGIDVAYPSIFPIIYAMISRISQTTYSPEEGRRGLCSRVQGAGHLPNPLNRFVQSNKHGVLFVT